MTDWVRLWHDMPTDPKWRVIARASRQPITAVISVFTMLLVRASMSSPRGIVSGFSAEDTAAALDMDEEAVTSILQAMQSRVLDGDRLSGWERRQPKSEDPTAAERKRAQRERETGPTVTDERVTQRHGASRDVTLDTETEADTEQKQTQRGRAPARDRSEFEAWYAEYPKHVGKDAAETAYWKARTKADQDALMLAARRFAAACAGKDKQYIAHPATWLNQGRWKDEDTTPAPPGSSGLSDDQWRSAAQFFVKSGKWLGGGGMENCPAHILAEFGLGPKKEAA